MGHDKLRKFAENETFACLLQPSAEELLSEGFFNLKDHPIKGHWAERMFGREPGAEIILELGCGKGEYTLDLARRYPDKCFIGVDIKGARLWKGAKTATKEKIPNVAFLRTRIEFITAFFAPGEISEIWLTFSDPQMKSENSRLSSPLFLERYRSFLRPGGLVHLKTDSRFLHEYTKAVVKANGLAVRASTQDLYSAVMADSDRPSKTPDQVVGDATILDPVVYEVQTFYEKMFLEMGLPITYMQFVIDHDGPYVHPTDFDEKFWREAEGPRRSFSHQPAKK
ncbi:MAG: tRNA (guanosine(46)-N7)-methyltransferase TrmB [Bacteroidales bacterium]|nr:tRNA (guanosine(46)-N7)-methyltransferase TrmB [Bacteroidales bacterium]